jgi:hypothetical protein
LTERLLLVTDGGICLPKMIANVKTAESNNA